MARTRKRKKPSDQTTLCPGCFKMTLTKKGDKCAGCGHVKYVPRV